MGVARRLSERRMVAGSDGNISLRVAPDRLLMTPSGRPFDGLESSDLVLVNLEGDQLEGDLTPTSETAMHLAVYRHRPEVTAAVHAHPPYATAFAVAGVKLEPDILPELAVFVGPIAPVRYATPGTEELAEALRELLTDHDAFLLSNHGLLTLGASLEEAYRRHEIVEHSARIVHLAGQLGGARKIARNDLRRLEELRRQWRTRSDQNER